MKKRVLIVENNALIEARLASHTVTTAVPLFPWHAKIYCDSTGVYKNSIYQVTEYQKWRYALAKS